uniref:hypothetical protein n=1 Tax=Paractinoplanes polyasparticus TaxID=2856853 RepID=UPI001C84E373|nr:hypothetical protein [Actinoplanes polyasparticus]
MIRSKRMILPLAAVAVAALAGCAPAEPVPMAHFDGPVYASVEEMADTADTVVSGTVEGVRAKLLESALVPQRAVAGAQSIPLALYDVDVERRLRGDSADRILVTRIDQDKLRTDGGRHAAGVNVASTTMGPHPRAAAVITTLSR